MLAAVVAISAALSGAAGPATALAQANQAGEQQDGMSEIMLQLGRDAATNAARAGGAAVPRDACDAAAVAASAATDIMCIIGGDRAGETPSAFAQPAADPPPAAPPTLGETVEAILTGRQ